MRYKVGLIGITIILLLFIIPFLISAGTTGKIKGKVTDARTGDPIAGAAIQLIGTSKGDMTDQEGKFTIVNIPPGKVKLKVVAVGYETQEISAVSVMVGQKTEVNIELKESIQDLDKVLKVVGVKDEIVKNNTSSEVVLNSTVSEPEPVPEPEPGQNVDQLLRQTAGVVTNSDGDILIRGGRAGENTQNLDKVIKVVGRRDDASNYIASTPPIIEKRCGVQQIPYLPPPPTHGGTAIVNGEPYDAMFFKDYGTNPFVDTEDDHLSTFAIDVDDASFVMTRSYLDDGNLPPDEAVRTEEFINHFKYNYTPPETGPFSIDIEGAPSFFGQNCQMLRVGIQGKIIDERDRKPANLIFVIDVSGSMNRQNRLELVKRSLTALVDNLNNDDRVGIIVYGSQASTVLEPTSVSDRNRIVEAIHSLLPGGSTNAEQGLRLGYQMAERILDKKKINRIVLCSDGVANVGHTSAEDLLKWIKEYADRGITLTTVGFGMGNYNDIMMEKLGNKGNGMYAYVDDYEEARRVFLENLTGMLQVIARDVKIQVDFDPEIVRSYRLLGYENRNVEDNKFRDDKEDGGEIGAGHQVTALYEVKFRHGKRSEADRIGTIFIRYKDPDNGEVDEVNRAIARTDFHRNFGSSSDNFKLAAGAAEFAEILGKSYWAQKSNLCDVHKMISDNFKFEHAKQVKELLELIQKSENLEEALAEK